MGKSVGAGGKRGLEKRAEVIESGGHQFLLGSGEIPAGLGSEHFQGVDHGFGGTQVDLFFATERIGDLPEKEPRILGLENDELIEPRIGFGRCWHGQSVWVPGGIYKWEDGIRKASAGAGVPQWIRGELPLVFCLAGMICPANLAA